MTAPDPGLTDLIAAHELNYESRDRNCLCGHRSWGTDTHAAHVALVVEQHTNGRIAELEADSRRTAFEDQDRIDELTVRMRRAEDAQDALKAEASGLRYDNEQLQATIARVGKLAHDMRGWCSPHGISVTYSDRIRAALEGEQQ